MGTDAFPQTLNTWIGKRLQEGPQGRAELNRHVMQVYCEPLQVYFRGCSDRWLGDPDDMVDSFFADRLARDRFFSDWQKSQKRLRRWIINAFCYFLMEERRRRNRDTGIGELPEELPSFEGNPEREVDRAFVFSILRRALKQTQKICESQGLHDHWRVFYRHQCEGQPYAECACEFNVEPTRARRMARTARDKFRETLRELVADDLDGASNEAVDEELQALVSILDS
jgi:RNA polymerase sigma-70 factor (ECF subfamily)